MTCIHQINNPEKLKLVLTLAAKQDILLFIEAAVGLLAQPELIEDLIARYQVKVLAQDLQAAGLDCPAQVQALTDAEWVELTLLEAGYHCW